MEKYYMSGGLPGTFLEFKATLNLINERVIDTCFKLFDMLMKDKEEYFKPTAPLAVVEILDSKGNIIFRKEEIK